VKTGKALDKKGIKAVAVEKYNIKDVDMTAQLLKAKQAGAEVVLTYGIGPELAQIANGMEKLGWKVPLIGSWTLSMANFIDNAGKNGNGTPACRRPSSRTEHAQAQGLHRRLRQSLQPAWRPHAFAGVGCAGLRLDLPAGRRHQAGRHRRPESQGRAGKPERESRRRGHHLQQAVSKTTTKPSRPTSPCSAKSRTARS
jgi:hypothetical protein